MSVSFLARSVRLLQILATLFLITLATINVAVNRMDLILGLLFFLIPVGTGIYAIWRLNVVFLVASAASLLLMDFRPAAFDLSWPWVTLFAILFLAYIEATHAAIRFKEVTRGDSLDEVHHLERVRAFVARYFRTAGLALVLTFVLAVLLLNTGWFLTTTGVASELVFSTFFGPLMLAIPLFGLFAIYQWVVRA